MADVIAPSKNVTFTLKRTPSRSADLKTLRRLMRMQPAMQKVLKKLSKTRYGKNYVSPRAGRMWMTRMPAPELVRPVKGESFTLRVTPQIMADLKAVERLLEAKPAK